MYQLSCLMKDEKRFLRLETFIAAPPTTKFKQEDKQDQLSTLSEGFWVMEASMLRLAQETHMPVGHSSTCTVQWEDPETQAVPSEIPTPRRGYVYMQVTH